VSLFKYKSLRANKSQTIGMMGLSSILSKCLDTTKQDLQRDSDGHVRSHCTAASEDGRSILLSCVIPNVYKPYRATAGKLPTLCGILCLGDV
jgi:hypothetical protein